MRPFLKRILDCQPFVFFGKLFVPASQLKIEMFGVEPYQGLSESATAGYNIIAVSFAAAKTSLGFFVQSLPHSFTAPAEMTKLLAFILF